MPWQFIATDLNGNIHGEITNASERKVTLPHMRVPTASFTIPLWHDLAPTLIDSDCLIRGYRTDPHDGSRDLIFHNEVVSVEETSQDNKQTIAVNSAGPFWRLSKRLIGKSKSGVSWGTPTPMDVGQIAHNVLATVNGESFTGISVGSRENTVTGTVGPWQNKVAAEAIAELHAGLSSFEYVVRPTEPTEVGGVGGWPQIGVMDIEAVVGTNRPDAIFEYGTGRANVSTYTRSVSREGLLTRGVISVEGWPDGTSLDLLFSPGANVASRGLFEELVNDGGVVDNALRQSVVDFHELIRKNPRQIITFKPVTNARPSPITDYNVGDTVRARAVVRGNVRFDAEFRIWGVTFDIDQNGNEAVELELVQP